MRNSRTEDVIREEARTPPEVERMHVDDPETGDVTSGGVAYVSGSYVHRILLFRVQAQIATCGSRATSRGRLADARSRVVNKN